MRAQRACAQFTLVNKHEHNAVYEAFQKASIFDAEIRCNQK